MSTKYVVAAAALATVAVTQAEATKFSIDKAKLATRPRPPPVTTMPVHPIRSLPAIIDAQLLEEDQEQADWNFNAGIQGGAGGKPQWNVGIGATWEEEEQVLGGRFVSSTGPYNPGPPPFLPFEEEQEQKLRLSKIVKGIKKANNVVNKAQQIGLLDEDEEAKANWNFNAGVSGGAGGKPQWNVGIGATWDEEEQIYRPCHGRTCFSSSYDEEEAKANWNFNAGVSGGAGGRPQWNASIGATWDEDSPAEFRRPKQRYIYEKKHNSTRPHRPYMPARPFNPLEEEAKLRLNKVIKGIKKVNNVVNKAQQVGLLEEDEEQLVTTGAVGSDKFNINLNHNSAVKDGRNWKEELKKAADLWKQARESGLLEEDEEAKANWNFNAGVSGGAGGKPQWNVGIGATWDEEQRWGPGFPGSSTGPYNPTPPFSPFEEEQGFGSKLDKFIGRVDNTINTIDRVKGLFDEDEQKVQASELIKIRKTCIKAKKTLKAAVEAKLLDEEEEQGFGSRLDRTLGRIDNTLNTIDRVKGLFQ